MRGDINDDDEGEEKIYNIFSMVTALFGNPLEEGQDIHVCGMQNACSHGWHVEKK